VGTKTKKSGGTITIGPAEERFLAVGLLILWTVSPGEEQIDQNFLDLKPNRVHLLSRESGGGGGLVKGAT